MIGERIKELRKAKDMTQTELAKLLETSHATVAMIETNKRKPSPDLLMKISNYFNCSIDFLLGNSNFKTPLPDAMPIGPLIKIAVIGTVKAGPDGIAYEELLGHELVEKKDINGGNYFYLIVKGDSMINDGIFPGDYVLVREQNDVEYGELAIAIVNGEEGTIKKIYKQPDSITLQSSNQAYPPRVFTGKDMAQVKIVGKVKSLMRKF